MHDYGKSGIFTLTALLQYYTAIVTLYISNNNTIQAKKLRILLIYRYVNTTTDEVGDYYIETKLSRIFFTATNWCCISSNSTRGTSSKILPIPPLCKLLTRLAIVAFNCFAARDAFDTLATMLNSLFFEPPAGMKLTLFASSAAVFAAWLPLDREWLRLCEE